VTTFDAWVQFERKLNDLLFRGFVRERKGTMASHDEPLT
jgi:hypothetical protein